MGSCTAIFLCIHPGGRRQSAPLPTLTVSSTCRVWPRTTETAPAAQAFQASHHLCESIVQEHAIVWAFLKEVCHDSMSPIQEARVLVASFPFFPDTPAICNAIAHDCHGSDGFTNTGAVTSPGVQQPSA